ncbi:oleosin GRP-17-like [Pyrus ussuriensis x Pyrus communis]|uniref:Oleosin GRP-17-like n=1 Tax=Pyrus ussuriensis x Pyrus communis TaxID=2448454 RepID=A0A5N5GHP9_9ROSA|nr:oleosin GRP-17-like [Pyrus ussuriensis x Pyrus communis]
MKTVSGIVLSSKPISLSKATSTLSSFVSSDTGASQEFSVYLRRTLASFKELKQLHKELKSPRSERKRSRRHRSETENDDAETVGENPAQSTGVSEVSHGLESKPETQRQVVDAQVKKKERKKGEVRKFGEDGGGISERGGEGGEKKETADSVEVLRTKKKKKKRDNVGNSNEDGDRIEKGDGGVKIAERVNGGVEKREPADSVDTQNKKKKRGTMSEEVKKEESKKRKSGVLEDGGSGALGGEQGDKKKKRRKS